MATISLLVIATFSLVRFLPGDVIDVITDGNTTVESRAQLEELLGLDEPALSAFGTYVLGILRADFGESLISGSPVLPEIRSRIVTTGELALIALALSTLVGIATGILAAVNRGRFLDYVIRSTVVAFLATPNFWIATIVIVYGALWFNWAPPLRYEKLWENPIANLSQVWLPALILGLSLAASLSRMTRTMMLEELRNDHIRTARSKGLGERSTILRHGLPNVLIPILTLLGVQIAALLGGTVILEQIFGIPGLGRYLIDAISRRDYPVVQGIVLVIGIGVVAINFVVDLLYTAVDPRLRLSGGRA
ncbi:MAG: ABC transporter permease, partial [Dehalococcoidia bacterium]